jgi:hypothetical protein
MLTAAAMFLAAGAVACSSDIIGAPALDDAQITADIAASTGDAVVSQVAGFSDNTAAAGMPTGAASFSANASSSATSNQSGLAAVAATCTYAAGRYSCSASTEQGLSVTRSFAFYNAQGQTVQNWDPAVVESANFQAQIDGTFTKDLFWNAEIHRTADLTVSGLISQAPQRVWNGTGTSNDVISHVGLDGIRTLTGTSTVAVTNVRMPGPDATSQIPLSGSITVDVQYTASLQGAAGSVSREATRHVVVTFDGTSSPSLQIGSLHCVLHLATRSVDGCQ